MARYKAARGREGGSHSERVDVVVPTPKPTTTVGYEAHMVAEGNEVVLPEADRETLLGRVLEVPQATRRRSKK